MNTKKLSESSSPGFFNTGGQRPKATPKTNPKTKTKTKTMTNPKTNPKTTLDTDKPQERAIPTKKARKSKLAPIARGITVVFGESPVALNIAQAMVEHSILNEKNELGVILPDADRRIVIGPFSKRAMDAAQMLQADAEVGPFIREDVGRDGHFDLLSPVGISAIAAKLRDGPAVLLAVDSGSSSTTDAREAMGEIHRLANESDSWVFVFMLRGAHNADTLAYRFDVFDVTDCEPEQGFFAGARVRLAGVNDLWSKNTVDVMCSVKTVNGKLRPDIQPFHGKTKVDRALARLRHEGKSLREIGEMVGQKDKSTVSRWCKELPLVTKQHWDDDWLTDSLLDELGWNRKEAEQEDTEDNAFV